jgi:hypothetical protein
MTGLLALVSIPQAAQSTRTFFVTSTTAGLRSLLQSDRMAQLLEDESTKGAVSPYRAKREINFPLEIWQASFVNHRIRDAEVYKHHHTYIWQPGTEVRAWQEIKVNSGELNRRELYLYLRCRKLGAFAEAKDLSAPGLAHLDL